MAVWPRLRALDAADRRLLGETALLMLRVRAQLWVAPFAAVRHRLQRSGSSPRRARQDPERVAWAVAAVARRLPGMSCLVQSLAADTLLRRRGYHPDLHIGVRTAVPLEAHAWVECEGRIVAGDVPDLAAYGRLHPVGPPAGKRPDAS
jgi:hypothetical protein